MYNTGSSSRGYVLAAVLGAIGGGLVVALATKAIPKVMSHLMQNMGAHMQGMMAQMRESGSGPLEM